MPSTLTWIDHDPAARERTQRILALFSEKEVRDELGLGAIQSAIADQLFPTTSTIQTRARYFFFVPWVYRALAEAGTKPEKVERASKEHEQALITALLEAGESIGVIGRRSREALTRYASSVYWAGLRDLGVLELMGSQEDFHARFALEEAPWDPALPAPPAEFPKGATFRLRKEEASYVRDKLLTRHPESLFAHLASHGAPIETTEHVWELPVARTLPRHRQLLEQGRLFAQTMFGASLLYNLMLAEKSENPDHQELYRTELRTWVAERADRGVLSWKLSQFWPHATASVHRVTMPTRAFVQDWVGLAQSSGDLAIGESGRKLVRAREMQLKGGQSRFRNERALRVWSGASGAFMPGYRWRTGKRFLLDLYEAEV
ncbi:DUF6361 family protein [soil metagenome]